MCGHLTKDPPIDDLKEQWMEEDARLFIQIRNSIDSKVSGLVNHCEFVKELMDYLEFVFSVKGNVSRIFDVCKAFYRSEKQDQSLTEFFMAYKKIHEELNMLMPFIPDVKVQQSQREHMTVMGFLAALPSEYDSAKTQILSSPEISSLQETFSRILRIEVSSSSSPTLVSAQTSSALIGQTIESERQRNRNSGLGDNTRGPGSGGVVCYYCHKPGHVIRDCKKRQNRNHKFQSAYIASTTEASNQSVQFSAAELARFQLYQDSLRSPSTPITAIAESGNPNKCLVSSSSSKWVIDAGATDHMTGNSSLFSTFQSQPSPSTVTLADGSHSCVIGSGTIVSTPSIPLTSVLSLPNFSFNLMSVSKLTRALKCYISFFPVFCLFQDLMTKQIIGRGHESWGLYILDPTILRPIASSEVTTPFETHCRLGYPSMPLLKKLCPQFSNLLSLDCESCQFGKHHRLSYSPRVNKRTSAPFELVHSDVWGPCPVVSSTRFRYFVTFVDDYSRTTWLYLMNHLITQFHVYVQNLRSDNAKEYVSEQFQSFMLQHGILH